jgi:hypothetical protein
MTAAWSLAAVARRYIAGKGYVSGDLDRCLHQQGLRLLRPSYRNRPPRPGQELLKPIRQLIESVNDTLKGQMHWNNTAATLPPASPPGSASASSP